MHHSIPPPVWMVLLELAGPVGQGGHDKGEAEHHVEAFEVDVEAVDDGVVSDGGVLYSWVNPVHRLSEMREMLALQRYSTDWEYLYWGWGHRYSNYSVVNTQLHPDTPIQTLTHTVTHTRWLK